MEFKQPKYTVATLGSFGVNRISPDYTEHSQLWIEIIDHLGGYVVRQGCYAICSKARQFTYSQKEEAMDFYEHHKKIIENEMKPKSLDKYDYPGIGVKYANYSE